MDAAQAALVAAAVGGCREHALWEAWQVWLVFVRAAEWCVELFRTRPGIGLPFSS